MRTLHPQDVYPCTFDASDWSEAQSIRVFFGEFCHGDRFAYDIEMRRVRAEDMQTRIDGAHAIDWLNTAAQASPRQMSDIGFKGRAQMGKRAGHGASNNGLPVPTPLEGTPTTNIRTGIGARSLFDSCTDASGGTTEVPPNTAVDKIRSSFSARIAESRRICDIKAKKDQAGPLKKTYGDTASVGRQPATLISAMDPLLEGTSSIPIDISDDEDVFLTPPPQQSYSPKQDRHQGNFLEAEEKGSEEMSETQPSLSDSAFDSHTQTLPTSNSAGSLERRKHAYVKARDYLWSSDNTNGLDLLISSSAGHGGKEMEL